ncbi:GAP family protein [Mycobacterium sp. pUA109]|uniref:GAP family protein n=1 Tax=Mycobacterium sp. pUA109 TaxID=3238982 RepID=UPI00351B6F1C
MWSTVLGVTLLMALDPVRFGFILLLISRPRPVPNLLAYWGGFMLVSVPYLLVPLMMLHVTPAFKSFAHDLTNPATAASATARHVELGIGALTLVIAALMVVRFPARQRAQLPTPGGTTSTLVLDSDPPPALSRLHNHAAEAAPDRESLIRRLIGRARKVWDNGAVWVSFVIGLGSMPPIPPVLLVLTTVAASGASTGAQVSAALAFLVGTLAVVEIIMVSYLATPAKTQAILQVLQNWLRPRSRQILAAIFAVIGALLVVSGMHST